MQELLDRLKAALADRYAIQEEIGAGGMATVYLAEDLKHERQVAVKVLRPELAAALGPERFLREIKITAQLNHPHILPLLDSGEANGFLYYVMPYVEGESLRDRINREKQLPVEDSAKIASEVADALDFAHGHDVIHRDVKPENILLEAKHAVVADFGIAKAIQAAGGEHLTETGIAVGTPTYMSPEQAGGTADLDGRSDIYSLGCVLYEMLAGEAPFTGPTTQSIVHQHMAAEAPLVTTIRENVPLEIAGAVGRALAKTPADRFPTAAQFAEVLEAGRLGQKTGESAVARRRRVLTWQQWLATTASVVVVVAAAFLLIGSGQVDFAERDWILIAEFENQTGDTIFDGSLHRALSVGLQQSRYVNVLPSPRVAETLTRMGRARTEIVDETVGKEIALRQGVRVVVVPSISRIDSVYVLIIRVVDPQTSADLVARSAEATGKAEVLKALDKLARRLRRDLGESLLAVVRQGVQLDHATTPSLEALRAWTEGNRRWDANQMDEAAALYHRAVELDSNFAMAHNDLGQYYYWRYNDRPRGDYHFDKALSLADRVTDREQFLIQAKAASWRGDREAAIRAYNIALGKYPDSPVTWSNLGYEYLRLGRWEDAIGPYQRAIELDSLNHNAYVNLATIYNGADRHEEALPLYLKAFEIRPSYRTSTINHEFGFNYVAMGDLDAAAETFSWLESGSREQRARGNRSMALLRMYAGRYDEAIELLRRAIRLDQIGSSPVTELRDRTYLVAAWHAKGATDRVQDELAKAKLVADTAYIEPFFLATLGKLFARGGSVTTAREILETVASRATQSQDDQAAVHSLSGEIALAENDVDGAISHFEQAVANRASGDYLVSLALGHVLTGNLDAARRYYEEFLEDPSLGAEQQEPWILAHYDLGRVHEETGDTTRAIEYYDRFLEIWKDGDRDLVQLIDARKRLASLTLPDRPR